MQDTETPKTVASEKRATLGAQVDRSYWSEFKVIQEHRGDESVSDTVRVALEEFRIRHWRARLGGEAA